MKTIWKDSTAALLVILGGVVVFAKLQHYSWWLIGSWTGALGVIAVIGLLILLTNVVELLRLVDSIAVAELCAWVAAATVIVASLFTTTTKAEFIWSSALVALAWLVRLSRHVWHGMHTHHPHYIAAG